MLNTIVPINRLTAESISSHTNTERGIVIEFLSNKEDTSKHCPNLEWPENTGEKVSEKKTT